MSDTKHILLENIRRLHFYISCPGDILFSEISRNVLPMVRCCCSPSHKKDNLIEDICFKMKISRKRNKKSEGNR